jgi:hypothetical protein
LVVTGVSYKDCSCVDGAGVLGEAAIAHCTGGFVEVVVLGGFAGDVGFFDVMRDPECGSALPHPIGIGR